jgi:hypothetical protein
VILSRTKWMIAATLVALTIAMAGTSGTGAGMAVAQGTTPRTVSGAVLDANDQAQVGVTVFLRNTKTKSVRSFTSVEKGHFYFAQVSRVEDFELWAEKGDKKTAVKTISSWDNRSQVVSDLKLK